MTGSTRAQRMAMPLARDVVRDLAVEHGACIRPVQLRRRNLDTGEVDQVLVPCGHTLASVCPACAERAKIAAGRAVPGRLAPRGRTRPPARPGHRGPEVVDHPCGPKPSRSATRPHAAGDDTADFDELITELDEQITSAGHPRESRPGQARTAAPLHPPPPGRPGPAPPQGQPSHGRQDLHRAGRQDLPAVAVRHLDLPVLRPGRRGRSTRRPRHLRLRPRGPGRAGLRRAVRPVHPEPAPLRRLRPAVLRRHRTPAAPRPARPHRHARHHRPRRDAAASWPPPTTRSGGPPPAPSNTTATSCRSGTRPPATTSTRPPGKSCPAGTRPSTPSARRPAVPRGPVRRPVRRPGRARRVQGRQPVHRLPDQVPDQAGRRLPPAGHRRRARPRRPGWPRRYGTSRARRGARTGSATASSPRTPGPAWCPAAARAKPTTPITSATPGAGCWPPASGPARPCADHRADRKQWLLSTLGVSATDPARYAWELVAPGDPDHMDARAAAAARRRRPRPMAGRARAKPDAEQLA